MNRTIFSAFKVPVLSSVGLMLGSVTGCSTSPTTDADTSALTAEAGSTITAFTTTDPSLREMLSKAPGYAVFPDVGKAGFIAGGAYGRGEVYEYNRLVGYADLAQGTVGLQIGAQTYDELIIFFSEDQLNKFKHNEFAFSANVSAVAIKPGVAAAADHSKGSVVFIRPRGGLMAEASIGGQKFTFNSLQQAAAERSRMNSSSNGTHASGN